MSAAGGAGAVEIEPYKEHLIEPNVKVIFENLISLRLSRDELNQRIQEIKDYLFNAKPLPEWFDLGIHYESMSNQNINSILNQSAIAAAKYHIMLSIDYIKGYYQDNSYYEDEIKDTFNSVIAELQKHTGGYRRRVRKSRRRHHRRGSSQRVRKGRYTRRRHHSKNKRI
jgi:hypothetical protein